MLHWGKWWNPRGWYVCFFGSVARYRDMSHDPYIQSHRANPKADAGISSTSRQYLPALLKG